jgi:ribosomal protein L20A (L18A)
MDENLTSVNAGQVSDESSQTQNGTTTVNAVNADTATGNVNSVQSAEDNARFAEIRRRAESEARDKLIAEMYGDSHGIRTYAEYQQALEETKRQEELEKLVQQNIPEDYAVEMMESRKFRQQFEEQQRYIQERQIKDKMYQEFLEAYPEFNDSEKAKTIPQEVWSKVREGKNLLDAFNNYKVKEYQKQFETIQNKEKAAEANQTNAQTSTGSVKGEGNPGSGYISKEVFESNKNNTKWMYDNYDLIKKSMGKWGK